MGHGVSHPIHLRVDIPHSAYRFAREAVISDVQHHASLSALAICSPRGLICTVTYLPLPPKHPHEPVCPAGQDDSYFFEAESRGIILSSSISGGRNGSHGLAMTLRLTEI